MLALASVSLSDCHCNVGYSGPSGETCEPCADGTFKNETGAGACQLCPAFASSPNASTLQTNCTCGAGYRGVPGGPCGLVCPAGAAHSAAEQVCRECNAGTYKALAGDHACTPCPAFSHHALTNQTRVEACVCQIGFLGNAMAQGCSQCAAGTFNNRAGDVRCFDCIANVNITLLESSVPNLLIRYKFDTIPVDGGKLMNYGSLGTNYNADIRLTSDGIQRRIGTSGEYHYFWTQNSAANNFLSIPNNFVRLLSPTGHSIAFWAEDNNVLDDPYPVFCGTHEAPFLRIHSPWSDGNVYYDAGDSTNYARLSKSSSVVNGQRTHWVFSRSNVADNNMILTIHKNSVLFHTSPQVAEQSSTAATNYPFFIGYNLGSGNSFFKDQTLEEFRVYDKALTIQEISSLYTAGLTFIASCSASASDRCTRYTCRGQLML